MTLFCAGFEPSGVKFGSGKKFSTDCPTGLIRFSGILLPGNCWFPFAGSSTRSSVPLLLKLCEKSPARSAAVGVYLNCCEPATNWPVRSCDQKKNAFLRSRFQCFGMKIGPPIAYVSTLYRYGTRGVAAPFFSVWLLSQVLELNCS